MGNRFQKRNKAVLPIKVSGVDTGGREFTVFAHTLDINTSGARLGKIQPQVKCGDELTLHYRNNKVRFVVRWIGPSETAVQGQLGLECLEPTKDLWPLEASTAPPGIDDFEIQEPKSNSTATRDTRYPCNGIVEVRPSRAQKGFSAHIEDISAEGCRIRVLAALPIGTSVSLMVRVEGIEIEGTGIVRTSFPGEGMGIFFTHFATPADKDRLKLLISKLQSIQSGVLPALSSMSSNRSR
jgi:hypothetical protein